MKLKDEVEQLLKLPFCLIKFYHPCQLVCVFGSSDPGYYFRFSLERSRSIIS